MKIKRTKTGQTWHIRVGGQINSQLGNGFNIYCGRYLHSGPYATESVAQSEMKRIATKQEELDQKHWVATLCK